MHGTHSFQDLLHRLNQITCHIANNVKYTLYVLSFSAQNIWGSYQENNGTDQRKCLFPSVKEDLMMQILR